MVWAHSLGEVESNRFVQPGKKAEGRSRCHLQCSDKESTGRAGRQQAQEQRDVLVRCNENLHCEHSHCMFQHHGTEVPCFCAHLETEALILRLALYFNPQVSLPPVLPQKSTKHHFS